MSDPKKRQKYDEFGDDGEDDFNSTEWLNAYEYYRALHPEITKKDYKRFVSEYKNSEEERQDLLDFYEENERTRVIREREREMLCFVQACSFFFSSLWNSLGVYNSA